MTIYGLFVKEVCCYIGSTNDANRRKLEHMRAIHNGKHSVKQLNDIDEVEFRELLVLETDNSFIRLMAEFCMNSIYKPKNKCVYQSGRNRITVARCDKELAIRILDVIKN